MSSGSIARTRAAGPQGWWSQEASSMGLFSKIFPALLFVQDWLGDQVNRYGRIAPAIPMVPQLACMCYYASIPYGPCQRPARRPVESQHFQPRTTCIWRLLCIPGNHIALCPAKVGVIWFKPDSAGWRFPVLTSFVQVSLFFVTSASRVWDGLRSLTRCHIFGWIPVKSLQILALVNPSICNWLQVALGDASQY